ncbi:MAG: ATP-dependent helicase [Chloroflexi bacterium]|nr:ATP-dependent helicase [Chloroflexota bacterium]
MPSLDDRYKVDERYRAFEDHEAGILVSLAGPGTGKTYSFLRRIRALIDQKAVESSSIAYLTFVREISKAFVMDYEEEFGAEIDRHSRPRISTLHSLACRIIRNRGFSIGYDGPLYFASLASERSATSNLFLTDLLPHAAHLTLTTVPRLREALKIVKNAWRNDHPPEALDEPIPTLLGIALQLARSYRLVDWDHAVPLAHELYQDPMNRQQWLAQLQHYLVDEFQDFNRAEQAFISSIAAVAHSMVIVGDDSQSIFRGRGGSPEGIRGLIESKDNDTITLLISRRCRANILQHINIFLQRLRRGAAPMLPHYDGGELGCFRFKSTKAELAFLVQFLNEAVQALPAEPRNKDGIVCLFPTHKALSFYFESLQDGVPCYMRSSQSSDRRMWLSLALRLAHHPGQRFIERLLLESVGDIKPRHKKALVQAILENDVSPVEALSILADGKQIKGEAQSAALGFIELCAQLSSQDPGFISMAIVSHLGLEEPAVLEAVTELVAGIGEHDQDKSIDAACDHLLPETALPQENLGAVLFSTIHASKGLTKRTVVMPGLEDAWLPGDAHGEDEEERARLFYVAISRATHQVQITYPQNRARGDPLNYQINGRGEASRFVAQSGIREVYHS